MHLLWTWFCYLTVKSFIEWFVETVYYHCSAAHRKSKGSLARRLQQVRLANDHVSPSTRSSRRLRPRRRILRSSVSLRRQHLPSVNGLSCSCLFVVNYKYFVWNTCSWGEFIMSMHNCSSLRCCCQCCLLANVSGQPAMLVQWTWLAERELLKIHLIANCRQI